MPHLVVGSRVGANEKTGLDELDVLLIGKSTRSVTSTNVVGASGLGVLEHSTGSVGARRDDEDVFGVLNGHDDACSEHELFPSLAEVDEENSVGSTAPDVAAHFIGDVLGTNVGVGGQEELEVLCATKRNHHFQSSLRGGAAGANLLSLQGGWTC